MGNDMLNLILETYEEEEFLLADGFNDAIIGVEESSLRLIYSISKCIDILMSENMSREDAIEYFEFNVSGAFVGDRTPIWCDDDF